MKVPIMKLEDAKRRGNLLIQAADIIESWSPELREAIMEVLGDDSGGEIEPPTDQPRWKCPMEGCNELLTARRPSNHWRFSTEGQVDKPASGVWHDPDSFPETWPPSRAPDNDVPT